MKKFRLLSAFLVILSAVSFTACSDEDPEMMENGNGGPGGPGVFKVNFDERQYIVNGDEVSAAVSGTNGVTISASNEDTAESFTISFIGNRVVDENTQGGGYAATVTYVGPSGIYTNVDPVTGRSSGRVRITNITTANKTISGQFSFMAWNTNGESKSFYNGRFENITYTGTLPEPGKESFKAKVNSAETTFVDITSPNVNGVRTLTGTIAANSIIQLIYSAGTEISVGTFPLVDSPTEGIVATYTNVATATTYVSTSGTVKILEVGGGWVRGTFNFEGTNSGNGTTVQITEGEFDMKLD